MIIEWKKYLEDNLLNNNEFCKLAGITDSSLTAYLNGNRIAKRKTIREIIEKLPDFKNYVKY